MYVFIYDVYGKPGPDTRGLVKLDLVAKRFFNSSTVSEATVSYADVLRSLNKL